MGRYLQDLVWLLLTLLVLGIIWSAAMDLYYGGGYLLAAGFDKFTAIMVYLVLLVALYAIVKLADS